MIFIATNLLLIHFYLLYYGFDFATITSLLKEDDLDDNEDLIKELFTMFKKEKDYTIPDTIVDNENRGYIESILKNKKQLTKYVNDYDFDKKFVADLMHDNGLINIVLERILAYKSFNIEKLQYYHKIVKEIIDISDKLLYIFNNHKITSVPLSPPVDVLESPRDEEETLFEQGEVEDEPIFECLHNTLPNGWSCSYDEQKMVYYISPKNIKTSIKPPSDLPDGWSSEISREHGLLYFISPSDKSTYDKPPYYLMVGVVIYQKEIVNIIIYLQKVKQLGKYL